AAVGRLRALDVQKPPGVAEAIDWTAALQVLGLTTLTSDAIDRTLGSVLKDHDDELAVRAAGLEHIASG
ncbi:MAG: MoxR family ATPase, partial [Candidatus Binatia bacterium]